MTTTRKRSHSDTLSPEQTHDWRATLTLEERDEMRVKILNELHICAGFYPDLDDYDYNAIKNAKKYEKSIYNRVDSKTEYLETIESKLEDSKLKRANHRQTEEKLSELGFNVWFRDERRGDGPELKDTEIDSIKATAILNCFVDDIYFDFRPCLKLTNCVITDEAAKAIASLLTTTTKLKYFYLEQCTISMNGIQAIATALASNSSLKILFLNKNQINDVGAQAIAHALISNSNLKILELSENNISDLGARAIASSLKFNKSLISLYLYVNKMTEEGSKFLLESLEANNRNLKSLGVDSSDIGTTISMVKKTLVYNSSLVGLTLFFQGQHHGIGAGIFTSEQLDNRRNLSCVLTR